MSTPLETWLENAKATNKGLASHGLLHPNLVTAIAVIEKLKEALEWYSVDDPRFVNETAKAALALDPDSLLRNSNKEE